MTVENTDLERRVLAHEQILQALMAQLVEGRPDFLDRLRERFASARRGAHEHDYTETADYAETFLHEVMRLVRVRENSSAEGVAAEVKGPAPAAGTRQPEELVVIRTSPAGGIWHVTCDHVFIGDYLAEGPARAAAEKLAHDIEGRGGRAELVFERPH